MPTSIIMSLPRGGKAILCQKCCQLPLLELLNREISAIFLLYICFLVITWQEKQPLVSWGFKRNGKENLQTASALERSHK